MLDSEHWIQHKPIQLQKKLKLDDEGTVTLNHTVSGL